MMYLNHVLSKNSPLYGGLGSVDLERVRQIPRGDSSNNTEFAFSAHSGTHIDAPYHFDAEGKSLDDYPAEFWFCHNPFLIEKAADKNEIISLEGWLPEFDKIPEETDLLIIKTGFERFREQELLNTDNTYIFDGPGISPEIGCWLRKNRKLKMVGFDFISLTGYQNRELGREAHRAFLSREYQSITGTDPILIIEDMKLKDLSKSPTTVIVVPLLFQMADGSPATILAALE